MYTYGSGYIFQMVMDVIVETNFFNDLAKIAGSKQVVGVRNLAIPKC